MKNHLSDGAVSQMTIVNPPPVQEMDSNENKDSAASAPPKHGEHTNMEMQPL